MGAWGCGVFGHDAGKIAMTWKKALSYFSQDTFDSIHFGLFKEYNAFKTVLEDKFNIKNKERRVLDDKCNIKKKKPIHVLWLLLLMSLITSISTQELRYAYHGTHSTALVYLGYSLSIILLLAFFIQCKSMIHPNQKPRHSTFQDAYPSQDKSTVQFNCSDSFDPAVQKKNGVAIIESMNKGCSAKNRANTEELPVNFSSVFFPSITNMPSSPLPNSTSAYNKIKLHQKQGTLKVVETIIQSHTSTK